MAFVVYILRCRDGSYYVGHTDNLERRLAAHQTGEIPGYTRNRRPVRLVFSVAFSTRDEALAMERRIKGWSREKKEALIRQDWGKLQNLAQTHVPLLPSQVAKLSLIKTKQKGRVGE